MTRRARAALLGAALVGLSASAHAAPSDADRDRASARYREGLAAHDKKDFPAAARHFAEADAIAPNAVALGAALDAAVDADDPVLGQELLDRAAERTGRPPELDQSIANARAKLGGRAGKIRASCAPETTCQATLDGASVKPGAWTYARAGAHEIVFVVGEARETRRVTLQGGEGLEIAASTRAPPPPAGIVPPPVDTADRVAPPPPPPVGDADTKPRRGLSPIVFYLAAGGTVLAAGGGLAGAFLTKSKHDDFVAAGCPTKTTDACDDQERTGKQTQLVTNLLFAGAGVGLIATTVIGLVLVDWRGGSDPPKQTSGVHFGVGPTHGGLAAGLEGRF